ncbi:MAG TPA: DUF1918 domain-containing protein [Pseudonocardiaceae bacterium]|jgi:hypothetical protein|nr:DUF1918 domain-containing protein [Pseudonocardiaceae bacterium]
MRAKVGDQLHVRSKTVGVPERLAEIIEVRNDDGSPPYRVRFGDGHEALMFPGPDCLVTEGQ